ncbi:MAG: pilus assembly FimT family protein [Gammaproteobacteria bacterium]
MSPLSDARPARMAIEVHRPSIRHRGFTVTELLVVVIILGVLAAVVTPGIRSGDPEKLELAAVHVAEAIRLARSEAMRTGEVYGITISQATQQVRVRRYDITADPVDPLETMYHPVSKQLLDFDFDTLAVTSGARIMNAQDVFGYSTLGRRRTVLFSAQGVPMWIVGSGPTTWALTDGDIGLALDSHKKIVSLAPYTGRVTIR